MRREYLIIGQGIAGSLIAYELLKRGATLNIINRTDDNSSSNVAAGLYNPVTGRKMVKTWNADKVFDGLEFYYEELEKILGDSFLHKTGIYRPFFALEEQNEWQGRISDGNYKNFIEKLEVGPRGNKLINDPYGGLNLKNAGYVDVVSLLRGFKDYFVKKEVYEEQSIDYQDLDISENRVVYNDVSYSKVIFCEGSTAKENPYFNWLPFKPVKGEILDLKIDYDESFVLNRGVFLLPKSKQNISRLGSTYENHQLNFDLTEKAINYLREKLGLIYERDFTIAGHKAGIRPATLDRKPFIGIHPAMKELTIFNGFGTKGVSLAVYYSRQFAEFLINKNEIEEEVNIKRYFSFYTN